MHATFGTQLRRKQLIDNIIANFSGKTTRDGHPVSLCSCRSWNLTRKGCSLVNIDVLNQKRRSPRTSRSFCLFSLSAMNCKTKHQTFHLLCHLFSQSSTRSLSSDYVTTIKMSSAKVWLATSSWSFHTSCHQTFTLPHLSWTSSRYAFGLCDRSGKSIANIAWILLSMCWLCLPIQPQVAKM